MRGLELDLDGIVHHRKELRRRRVVGTESKQEADSHSEPRDDCRKRKQPRLDART